MKTQEAADRRRNQRRYQPNPAYPLTNATNDNEAGEVTYFNISFAREDASYKEGDQIRGHVTVELKQSISIDELTIEFTGKASLDHKKQQKSSKIRKSTQAIREEIHTEHNLNQRITLYGGDDSMVSAGRHIYSYLLQLPYNIPSSIIGDYGSIRYEAVAAINIPWQPPIVTSKEFHIKSILDLNKVPNTQLPVTCEKTEDNSGPLCIPFVCSRDHYVIIWRLDRTGYVPGEKIRINAEIHNNGKLRIRKSKAWLIQHLEFYQGWQGTVRERKIVALVEKGAIDGGHIGFWREEIEVPPLPPSGLKGCDIINLWYTLKLKVFPHRFLKTLDSSIEITIGTISLDSRGRTSSGDTPIVTRGGSTSPHRFLSDITSSDTRLDAADQMNYFV